MFNLHVIRRVRSRVIAFNRTHTKTQIGFK